MMVPNCTIRMAHLQRHGYTHTDSTPSDSNIGTLPCDPDPRKQVHSHTISSKLESNLENSGSPDSSKTHKYLEYHEFQIKPNHLRVFEKYHWTMREMPPFIETPRRQAYLGPTEMIGLTVDIHANWIKQNCNHEKVQQNHNVARNVVNFATPQIDPMPSALILFAILQRHTGIRIYWATTTQLNPTTI
jgi:hypothetical protein